MFPAPWSERWTTEFEIDGAVLSHLLSRVEFAQEKDVSRTYLMGVRMETKRMISTNGACLVYVDNDAIPQMDGVTIPTRMVAEMSRMTTLGPAVKVGISDSKISLTSDNSTVISKLLDKSLGYPDYIRVIPKEPPSRGTVKTVALVSAIRRAMISATEGKARTVRLGFSTGGISVTARNSISDAMDEIDAEFIGEDVTLPFDPDLMISILNSIPSDTAEFRVGPVKTATTWKALGGEDGVLVAMPQRVGT